MDKGLQDYRSIVKDKSILIIGNWSNQVIIPADITVRFNRAGLPCDIWSITGIIGHDIEKYYRKTKHRYLFNLKQRATYNYPNQINIPNQYYRECINSLGIDKAFSGTFFLWLLLNYSNPSDIAITGFNCFQHKTLQSGHEKDKLSELAWIQNLANQKKIQYLME